MYPKAYLYKRIQDAKIIIDREYTEKINLDHIARKVYLSKYHFLRLFKEAYGTSPHRYLTMRRIEKAKSLLQTDLPITEICHQIGFESPPSFTNLFRRHTGISPSEFRNQSVTKQNSNIR